MNKNPHFHLFTDGSCGRGQDEIGAWAAFVVGTETRKLMYGCAHPTSVTRCEMMPILEGLRWIRKQVPRSRGVRVRAYSDSEFIVKTLSEEYEPGKNMDLWRAIEEVSSGTMQIQYLWRERNSHTYMQLCDAVCSVLRKRVRTCATELLTDWKEPENIVPVVELPSYDEDLAMKGLQHAHSTHG